VEERTIGGLRAGGGARVNAIVEHGMSDRREMNPNLVLPARLELELHERGLPAESFRDSIMRAGGQRAGLPIGHVAAAVEILARNRAIDGALRRIGHTFHERKVDPLEMVSLEEKTSRGVYLAAERDRERPDVPRSSRCRSPA
jgi:hypothetical protein